MANKTEKKKVFIYLEVSPGGYRDPFVVAATEKKESWKHAVYSLLGETEIDVPVLSKGEMDLIANGALLEAVIQERDRYKAESLDKLKAMDSRIKELQSIEFKEGEA